MKEKTTKKRVSKKLDIKDALVKKALGYDVTETVEEYVSQDGEIVLSKKKVTKKNVPPDVTALKILLENEVQPVAQMSDEELESEKQRLLLLLKEKEKIKEKN